MRNYAGAEFTNCKKWIANKRNEGFSWDRILHFCVESGEENEFERLRDDELVIPQNMEYSEWEDYVAFVRENYIPVGKSTYGISNGDANKLPVPTDVTSAWVRYKNHLLGMDDGLPKMSGDAVDRIENYCHWILNHLERDTRSIGPVKGLVMGSVQSGKTANMIGLVTMAAHYDWNIFIILSGTIENLRKQTRDRFFTDLTQSGGLTWHILDHTGNSEYMVDLKTRDLFTVYNLKLNSYQSGKSSHNWLHRYVFVCLKNSRRLQNLITWLHSDKARAARMRILVIDDEADQASVNTKKMDDDSDEEEVERTIVNNRIINLIKGNDFEGTADAAQFQAMNYISFTATPYANVLNEAYKDSLYPSNFICSLPESKEYFGTKAIWGSKKDENYLGLDEIIRKIPETEMDVIKQIHKGYSFTLPDEFQKAIAWFLCAAAILRMQNYMKPISMLIHTTALQSGHFEEYYILKRWLIRGHKTGKILTLCEQVYNFEKDSFRLEDLKEGYPEYSRLNKVCDVFPSFDELKSDINNLLNNVTNIELGENRDFVYQNGIHLCVDNCRANKVVEDGTYLRVVYPSKDSIETMNYAPVFIVMGGNTLSRGLTLEGLVCTYFARNVNQADTLMQMARWFGYRPGYELLQRIWLTEPVYEKFELIEEIDEKLKAEFEEFMDKGKSPAQFGPRIMSSSKIARFTLTSKNKSQNMVPCDVDFSGDSYEVTQFENSDTELKKNIEVTEAFLESIGPAEKSDAVVSAYIWRNVDSDHIIKDFFDKYKIFKCSSLHVDIPIFISWMEKMNEEGKYLKWNVAVAGDSRSENRWCVAGADVGTIERSKKKKPEYIDIGSLRSGTDILSDIRVKELSADDKKIFDEGKTNKKKLINLRYLLGMSDIPLLILYRIDRNKGQELKTKTKVAASQDIIGFSIVVSGQENNKDYVKTVQVRQPD